MDYLSRVMARLHRIDEALTNRDQELLADLFTLDSVDAVQEVRLILDEHPHVLTSLCQHGLLDNLEYLLGNLPLDINVKFNGMTCLQYASMEGHSAIVKLLLTIGAQLTENIWEEQSEFYLASIHGHYDVINILLQEKTELVKDTSKCYCLFHAACKGGHVGMMQKWLRPDMNVDTEVAFVSSLNQCENQFPLYAACEGNHLEAVECLIGDFKATITKKICTFFPEIITKAVQNLFRIENNGQISYTTNDLDLECVLPMWFQKPSSTDENRSSDIAYEIKIDLSKNKLSEMPAELLWEIPDLVDLCVAHNPLKKIPELKSNASLQINCITSLDISFCELGMLSYEIFCLPSLKKLIASHNSLGKLYGDQDGQHKWKCKNLRELDLSHNSLCEIPQGGIQECAELESIYFCHNQLTFLCHPWQCPLKYLDISNNKIEHFPPSADQFWSKTLKRLKANNNLFDHIPESIIKMKCLSFLDLSNNKISVTPDSSLWICPLSSLDLSHNDLGLTMGRPTVRSRLSLKPSKRQCVLTFPGSTLKSTLTELDLSYNDLLVLPEGICEAESLSVLDLSFNIRITSLPYEFGKLKNLILLNLKGIKLQDKEIQDFLHYLDDPNLNRSPAREFVTFMERRRRKCRHHDVMKMVVFGCNNLGDQCVVRKLVAESNDIENRSSGSYHKSLEVSHLTLRHSKKYETKCKRNLSFHIWEMPDLKITLSVHSCFLTQNSLYLLVHDVSSLQDNIKKVSSQILEIQSCVNLPCIIVIGLFPGAMDQDFQSKLQKNLRSKFTSKFKCDFVPVVFSDKATWNNLRQVIYVAACNMHDSCSRKVYMVDREIPELFISSYEKIKSLPLPLYDMEHFTQETGIKMSDLRDTIGDRLTLHEHLLQVGVMLHYNVQMSDLANFIIIDPSWLFDLLSSFLENFVDAGHKLPKMSQDDVKKVMHGKIEDNFFKPFIKLLEFSNIAIQIMESKGKESLLIPSLLPKQPSQFLDDGSDNRLSTSRFYPLPAVPPSLWSHVISRLIAAVDRFKDPSWKFQDLMRKTSTYDSSQSLQKAYHRSVRGHSFRGLHVQNNGLQFWRTGISIWHDHGLVVVEQVKYQPGGSTPPSNGILITARTTTLGQPSDQESDLMSPTRKHLKKLAIIGIVKDELEEVLELYHPRFNDPVESNSRPMALCPNCYNIKPFSGIIKEEITHFYVRDCAQRILWECFAYCNNKPVLLDQLMPELLFLELPPEFVIAPSEIETTSVKLGHGMAGTVSKGYFNNREVAVKVFHNPMCEPVFLNTDEGDYPNIRDITALLQQSRIEKDQNDTEQRKISNAFSDIRREVGILSKLKHKCIISFIGVCVKRRVVLIMELAPFGSLRSQLDKAVLTQSSEQPMEDVIVTSSIFGKELTYKMILQITSGLSYLHSNHIIFRDLKPDNILVMSMDVSSDINVKLSDYGISKFSTLQGMSGLIGTIAYMAPEVIDKQAYTDKIDIYSLGLVMFEILTGIAPPAFDNQPMASQRNLKFHRMPSHIKKVTLHVNFPALVDLMSDCWNFYMDDRPSTIDVMKMLTSDAFMILHDCLWFSSPLRQDLQITCVYTCKSLGRWTLWVCESAKTSLTLKDRFMSVYDLKSSRFTIWRKNIPGAAVTIMAKVGNTIWMVCEGYAQLEEIVRGKENQLETRQGQILKDVPTALLCHRLQASKDERDLSLVLVGQENGNMTSYSLSHSSNKAVTLITSYQLAKNMAVSNLVAIRDDLIVATCGFHLFFLDIQSQTVGQSDMIFTVSIKNTFSCFQNLRIKEPIHLITAQDNAIWCIFKDTNLLLKLDCDSQEVLESVCFTWDSSRDQIRVEQSLEPSPFLLDAASTTRSPELSPQYHKVHSMNEENDDVFTPSNRERSATLPSHNVYGSEALADIHHSENIYAQARHSSIPEGNHEHEGIKDDEEKIYYNVPTLERTSRSHQSNTSLPDILSDNDSIYQNFTTHKPPIPPRTMPIANNLVGSKEASKSLPIIDLLTPPAIPRKVSNPETEVALTSVCLCSDILAVASNCGGFVLINVGINENVVNKIHTTFPSSSMQYPVLRHPKQKSLIRASVSAQKAHNSNESESYISNFLVVESKLISHLETNAKIRSATARSNRRHILSKRIGICLTDDTKDNISDWISSFERNEEVSTFSNAGVSSSETHVLEDDEQNTTPPADIVVWGDLSSEKLETISSYGRKLHD